MIVRTGITTFRVVCDECTNALELPGRYVAESDAALRADARRQGWVVRGSADYCPHHTPNR